MGYIRTGIRLLHSCLNWILILNWTQLQQKREEVVKVRNRGAGSGGAQILLMYKREQKQK